MIVCETTGICIKSASTLFVTLLVDFSPTVVVLLTVSRQFLGCSSSLFVRRWLHMSCLFCHSWSFSFLLLVPWEGLCFLIVSITAYLHYFS